MRSGHAPAFLLWCITLQMLYPTAELHLTYKGCHVKFLWSWCKLELQNLECNVTEVHDVEASILLFLHELEDVASKSTVKTSQISITDFSVPKQLQL